MAYFILTSVAERRISTNAFNSLKDAQKRMNTEFNNALLHPEYLEEDIAQGEVDIGPCSAAINYDYSKTDENLDWKITYLDDKGIMHSDMDSSDTIALEESQTSSPCKKLLSPNDISELLGQMIDILEDYLEERHSSLTEGNSDSNVLIRGNDYDILRNRLSETLQLWNLIP